MLISAEPHSRPLGRFTSLPPPGLTALWPHTEVVGYRKRPPPLSTLTSRATHAHPTSPRRTGFCAILDCISSSSSSLCKRICPYLLFEATSLGAAPGPLVKTEARVRRFRGCKNWKGGRWWCGGVVVRSNARRTKKVSPCNTPSLRFFFVASKPRRLWFIGASCLRGGGWRGG